VVGVPHFADLQIGKVKGRIVGTRDVQVHDNDHNHWITEGYGSSI
jgi:hypothetical protein